MQFCKAQVRAVKPKPTDWDQFFDRRRSNFANPARCVRFSSAQKKPQDVAPIAAHGSQICCCVLRVGAAADNASLSRRASRKFSSPCHHTNLHAANRDLGSVDNVNWDNYAVQRLPLLLRVLLHAVIVFIAYRL